MAPPAADLDFAIPSAKIKEEVQASTASTLKQPLEYSGLLEQYNYADLTPVIGREFTNLQLSDIVGDDNKVRDLAITGKFGSIYHIGVFDEA